MSHVRRLVGVGLGPGDPELLTCRAIRVLGEAGLVLVPPGEETEASGLPETVVRSHLGEAAPVVALDVPAGEESEEVVDSALESGAVEAVTRAFAAGTQTVVFATLGDPSVYSVFGRVTRAVLDRDPRVEVEVVPGITAMQALAAASRTPLVEGTESLTLVPATAGLATFTDALEHSDTVVAYRGGRYLAAMHGELSRRGRLDGAVLGEHVGLADECITALDRASHGEGPAGLASPPSSHATTVIVPAAREDRRR
ncbi:precorrin-2 C(20)-methyltransferase [Mobilicoccus massiliensis]|uniref:precorrin-2 C(20)-methyltransferase n=1 Tax=Mobilicoccus massiliensis TaxID=1522310 RepID=UPI0005908118|nr:precorrin-2 C(20)-methyltransferase [Mobilicoccus massiliensis]